MQAVLPGLAEREGTPRVALHAARHLASCALCAEALMRLRQINGLLDRLPVAEVPTSFTRRLLRALPKDVRWGAGVVLLLALGWGSEALPAGLTAPIAGWLGSRLDTLSDALAAGLNIVIGIFLIARAALQALPVVPIAPLPGLASPLPAHLLPLAGIALVTLLGSWAALARGAFSLQRERRLPRLPVI
jgi:anti-sigma factor RsiW